MLEENKELKAKLDEQIELRKQTDEVLKIVTKEKNELLE